MSKNINLQNMNAETLNILSDWNYAFVSGRELRKAAKFAVTIAQKDVKAVNDARATAIAGGMTVQEAVSTFSRVETDTALTKAEGELSDLNKNLRNKSNRAKKLVPDSLYKAYQNRKENKQAYNEAITAFLAEMGISGTERACEKVADALTFCLPTAKKATGKAKKEGHKVQDIFKTSYQDMFIAAFLEYAINEKGVLDQAEDGTLSFHKFEGETTE